MADNVQPRMFEANVLGIPRDELIRMYNKWDTYDDDMLGEDYVGHIETAKLVATYFPEETRDNVNILDIGAGTGLVGIELKKHGFTHVDALEPSISMMNVSKERGVYEKYICECLTHEQPCSINTGTYDCATASACFGGNYIPAEALVEVRRILKPGGLIFVTVRDLEENVGLIHVSEDLKEKGELSTLQIINMPQYRKGHKGFIYIFKTI